MTLPSLLEEPVRDDEPQAAQLYADVLSQVAAVGRPHVLRGDMVKPGAVVIDVGINRGADGKLCGDVDFAEVAEVAGHVTPVPGGVGPMTITMLMMNTIESAERLHGKPAKEPA